MNIQGYMITVEWDGEEITVEGTSRASRIALRGIDEEEGPVVLTRDQITDITFKDANPMVNGRLTLHTIKGEKYRLHFRRKQAAEFRVLKDALLRNPDPAIEP